MDKLKAMRSFQRVAQMGSFSAVADEENTTQSTISKRIAALESLLGVRLLVRSSRHQTLTEAGKAYLDRCRHILNDIDEAENQLRAQISQPRGLLRVTLPIDLSEVILVPILKPFLQRYPELELDLILDNQMLNLTDEALDVAIRVQHLADSSIIARPLCNAELVTVASLAYLQAHGTPTTPQALTQHNCILYRRTNTAAQWQFQATGKAEPGKTELVTVSGNLRSTNGQANKASAIAGIGIAQLPYWLVYDALEAGQLVRLLRDYSCQQLPVHALYHHRKYQPKKIAVFVDYLAETFAKHPAFCRPVH